MLLLKNLITNSITITVSFLSFCSCSYRGLIIGDSDSDVLHKAVAKPLQTLFVSELPSRHPLRSTIIGGRWRLLKKLDAGNFGEVYIGVDRDTGIRVAVKVEETNKYTTLLKEFRILRGLKGIDGFPAAHHFQNLGSARGDALVMDLLGPSLSKIFESCDCKLSLKTVLMLTVQMIDLVEALHQRHYVHRDIKPENFVIGQAGSRDKIYLIDFGVTKLYRDPVNPDIHIPRLTNVPFAGTYRYASLSALSLVEQSRRDDLESLGYIFVHLLNGSLPWIGLTSYNIRQAVRDMKRRISIRELCNGCLVEFSNFFYYVRDLIFCETPNYKYLRNLFIHASIRNGLDGPAYREWIKPKDS